MPLLDRVRERAELENLLHEARQGRSGALVLLGEPGMGKSALLDHAVAAAEGFTVTRVVGVESEQELGFAGLHRLLRPFDAIAARLPAPQRDALAAVFGRAAAPPPDRFLVGLAVLSVLTDAATGQPVLVVCDDAHWVDRDSLDVLTFVGRRLLAEGVVLLLAARSHDVDERLFDGLAHRTVPGLPADDATALLTAGTPVDPVLARTIVERVDGNPLVLVELARGLARGEATTADLAGDVVLGGPVPVGHRLEKRYLAQFRDLPPAARTLLVVLAADPACAAEGIRRATAQLLDGAEPAVDEAVEAAVAAGLVVEEPGRLLFRHPLIRSAVHRGAAPRLLRAAHAALAAASGDDDELRAWHLAAATAEPDAGVGAAVERAAGRVGLRGGHLARAALLLRAADLSPDATTRARRLVEAAGAALTAGMPGHAADLLDRLGGVDGPLAAHATRLRGLIALLLGRDGAIALLLDAATALRATDRTAARDALLEAFDAAGVAARAATVSVRDLADAAAALPPPATPAVADLLLDAHAALVRQGFVGAAGDVRTAVAAMRAAVDDPDTARWSLLGMVAALELWDEEGLGVCAARHAAAARNRGEPRLRQVALAGLATWELLCGRLDAAAGHFTEFHAAAAAISADPQLSGAGDVLLHGWRGDDPATRAAAARCLDGEIPRPGGIQVQIARAALVVLHLGHARYAEAATTAGTVFAEDPPYLGGLVLPDLVEAATRIGDDTTAEAALARLRERATASGTPWAVGVLTRAAAVRAPDRTAEAHHRSAVERLARTPLQTDLARAHLLYGEWLRRRKRRADATAQLRIAHELFLGMGAAAFTERAAQELRAAGGRPRNGDADPAAALTAQEARIAALAVDGATNQEIATTLYLSTSTVEYHLRKIFRKLGVTSRRQLRAHVRR